MSNEVVTQQTADIQNALTVEPQNKIKKDAHNSINVENKI